MSSNAVCFLLVLLVACCCSTQAHGFFGFGGGGGGRRFDPVSFFTRMTEDRCNSSAPCNGTLGEVCLTTRRGNRCRLQEMVPCRQDQDCPSAYSCYIGDGAAVGVCGLCTADGDCRGTFSVCHKLNITMPGPFQLMDITPRFGHCAECSSDVACALDQYCDTPRSAMSGIARRFFSSGGPPSFSCQALLVSGEACARDGQCESGLCDRGFRSGFQLVCQ